MKFGGDRLSDPIQQTLEAQSFQAERLVVAATVRQDRRVDPYPEIAQDQRDGDEHEPQAGVSCAGVNPRLPQLPVARFDAEAFAVAFANFGRRAVDAPSGEQQFLRTSFHCLVVAVAPIGHTNPDARRLLATLLSGAVRN